MYQVNDDNSVYVTRGDVAFIDVTAKDDGKPYIFQQGDLLRIKVFAKKDCESVVMQKDFPVTTATEMVQLFLDENDTKIGEVISKPRDYWYEIELNPLSDPKTIIGYDEDGAKVFKLFPEGRDLTENDPIIQPEDIPVVDEELSLNSKRPVENRVVTRALYRLEGAMRGVHHNGVTPEMFGAVGDGVADDTKALKLLFESGEKTIFLEKDYRISDSLEVKSNTTVVFGGVIYCDKNEGADCYSAIRIEDAENIRLYNPHLVCAYEVDQEWSHGIILKRTKDVSLYNVVCKNFADGVCVTYSEDGESYNDNLYVDSIIAEKCKRNGVTLECCKNTYIGRILGIEINGFEPNACLDIEHDKPGLVIENLTIEHIYSYKCAGGVGFILDGNANIKINTIDIVDGAFHFHGGKSDVDISSLRCSYIDNVCDISIMDNASVPLETSLVLRSVVLEGNNISKDGALIYVKCNSNTFLGIKDVAIKNIAADYLYHIDNYIDADDFNVHCRLFGVGGMKNKVLKQSSVKWLNDFSSIFESDAYSYSPTLLLQGALPKIRNTWHGAETTFEIAEGGSITIPSCSNFKQGAVLNTVGDRIKVAFEYNVSDTKAFWKVKNCFLLSNVDS